jgi:hypothetical protein
VMVMLDKFMDRLSQRAFSKQNQPLQARFLDGSDKALCVGIGEKRALQTVPTVAHKFSPLRIPFIPCEDRALTSWRYATTGAGIVSRIWAQMDVCARSRSSGRMSTSLI